MTEVPPTVRPPTREEVRELAAKHFISLSEEELDDFTDLIESHLESLSELDRMPNPQPETEPTPRDVGYQPGPSEDPYNAFVTRCNVSNGQSGPLDGYDIGVKDNVAVAGIEMTGGSKVLEGYVPARDATIVTRILAAGGTITGKTSMENLSASASGELSATGPVRNPRNSDHLAGGSSGGSAAAVVTGDVDLAIGCDQGGSIRIPSAWCGCVGLKPTFALVPYTGIMGHDLTIDHVGPMATSVADCARLLEVIAGTDPQDPRQCQVESTEYVSELDQSLADLHIGILSEGFGISEGEEAVDETVSAALDVLEDKGATVANVSIPYHEKTGPIVSGVAYEGIASMNNSDGISRHHKGFYDTRFATVFGKRRRLLADEFPPTLKLNLIAGQYLMDRYNGYYYTKAQNLRHELTEAYDEKLSEFDVLAMPTTPQTAHEIRRNLTRKELMERANNMTDNTVPFNYTGHPALSVPCGTSDGLPVGLQFIGSQFDDATVLRAGYAAEHHVEWE